MSVVFLWENPDGTIDACELDIYDTETHDWPAEITKFPVEKGPDVTDNIRNLPQTLTLEGYVSDSPGPLGNVGGKYGGSFQTTNLDVQASPNYQPTTVTLDVQSSPIGYNLNSVASAGFKALAGALGFGASNDVVVLKRGKDKPNESHPIQVWTWDHWESHAAEVIRLLEKARNNKVLIQAITEYKTYDGMALKDVQIPRKTEDGSGAPFSISLEHIEIVSALTTDAPQPTENLAKKTKSVGSKSGVDPTDEKEKNQEPDTGAFGKRHMISIPTISDGQTPYYTQRVNLDGVDYTFSFRWAERRQRWYLDLYDTAGDLLAGGVRLVTNWPLWRYYKGRPGFPQGEQAVVTLQSDVTPPGLTDLGIGLRCELVYFSPEDLA